MAHLFRFNALVHSHGDDSAYQQVNEILNVGEIRMVVEGTYENIDPSYSTESRDPFTDIRNSRTSISADQRLLLPTWLSTECAARNLRTRTF